MRQVGNHITPNRALRIQQLRKVPVQQPPIRIHAVYRVGELLPPVPERLLHLRLGHERALIQQRDPILLRGEVVERDQKRFPRRFVGRRMNRVD